MDIDAEFRMLTPADAHELVAMLAHHVEPGIDTVLVFDRERVLLDALPMERGIALSRVVEIAARRLVPGQAIMIVSNRTGDIPADRPDDELVWEELVGTASASGIVLVDWWVVCGTKAFSLAEHAPSGPRYGAPDSECECCRREAAGTLDDPDALPWEVEHLLLVHRTIAEHGFFIQAVMGSARAPSWAYTIGFLELGHPEVIVFGLDTESVGGALHLLHRELVAGHRRPIGADHPQGLGERGTEVCLLPVPASAWRDDADHFATAAAYYGALGWEPEQLRAVQMVWADPDGSFPWDARFAPELRALQPVLDPACGTA